MNPLFVVAQFEFRYHLRQPVSLLFATLIFGQGVWYTYSSENLYLAQSIQTYTILSSIGIALAAVSVLLAGQSLTKDSAYKTAAYLYTLPVSRRLYFAGRFLGTFSFALLLAILYPLGILLILTIRAAPESVALLALADGFLWLIIPNVFICVSLAFSSTVFLRSIWGAYACLFLIVMYFLLADSQASTNAYADIWQLLDPFGTGMIRESIDKMSLLPNSDMILSFSDILIINRLLWAGLALCALAQAEARFSFDTFTSRTLYQKPVVEQHSLSIQARQEIPTVELTFNGWIPFQTILRIAKLDFQTLTRHPIFRLTIGLFILLVLWLATVYTLNPDFPEMPVTSRMTDLRDPMGLFMGLFLLVTTSELIFQERTSGFWFIFDALPQPNVVLLAGKLLALIGIAAVLTVVLFLTGVGLQVSNGFFDIDWSLYQSDLVMDGFFRYCQLILLGACVATLVNSRQTSHILNILIFGLLTLGYHVSSPDQQGWLYSFLPGSTDYSDLIGYGWLTPLRPVFHRIWWGTAGILVCLCLLTWNRGVPGNLRMRLRHIRYQWHPWYALLLLGSFLVIGAGFWQLAKPVATTPELASRYKAQTVSFQSLSGKLVPITVRYHHPYQVTHILLATQAALHKGEKLFGAYPYPTVQIDEVPATQHDVLSMPGTILISEKQGWIADNRQPAKLDYIDYLISREVFKQWLVHSLHPIRQAGDGFISQSLAEYLALQTVGQQYGSERLKQRLAQRTALSLSNRNRSSNPDVSLRQSSRNDALERERSALALTSISQVWGNAPLSLTIGQFYQNALSKKSEATAVAFNQQLTDQLHDSLKYLTTYLYQPIWFDFKIGKVASLPNGLTVEILTTKWKERLPGVRKPLPSIDFIPLVVLDQNKHEIYRQLVRPNPDQPFILLPALPTAKMVLIDPLGSWPEQNKWDNHKLL